MLPVAKVFLDTSVIFAAVLSPNGGARMVFRLGEIEYLQLMAGKQALKECEEVVRRKAPETLPELAVLLDVVNLVVAPEASAEHLERARALVTYPPDALILAEALQAEPDWLLSHDHQRLLSVPAEALPFRIGTPGDLLTWLRVQAMR
jgi:predicted nucleic acid-binding protein